LSREALVIVQFAGRPLLAQSGHSENLRCPFCADTVAKAEWISGALPNIGVQCGACAEEFEAIRAGNFRIDYLVVEPPVPPTSRLFGNSRCAISTAIITNQAAIIALSA
jgi:hypothetical protein